VAPKKAIVKKGWNPSWWLRNGCDVRLIARNLITTIRVNLVANPSEMWKRQHKFTWILSLLLTYHHSHFSAATLDFMSFFTMAFLGAAHFFYSWAVFGLDYLLYQRNIHLQKYPDVGGCVMSHRFLSYYLTYKCDIHVGE